MSTTIDNKIVEMSFNNTDFEKNAQQSIETTEKLKKSLNFDGVGKGLEQISSAAKGCDLSVLTTAASAVGEVSEPYIIDIIRHKRGIADECRVVFNSYYREDASEEAVAEALHRRASQHGVREVLYISKSGNCTRITP